MTLAAGVLVALLRAIVVSALACAVAHPIAATWRALPRRRARGWATAFLVTPLLTPALVIGYAYGSLWALAMRWPWANEVLYASLLLMRLAPVAVGVLLLTPPPPIGSAGLFTRKLAPNSSDVRQSIAAWSFFIRSRARAVLLAFLAVFLLAFSDLEMANLFHATAGGTPSAYSWTIWQFDLQAIHPPISESLRTVAAPVAIQLTALLAGAAIVLTTRGRPRLEQGAERKAGRATRLLARLYMSIAMLVSSVAPMTIIIASAVRGVSALERDATYFDGLQWSILYAGAAMTAAGLIAWGLLKVASGESLLPRFARNRSCHTADAQASKPRRALRVLPLIILCVPGLVGSIVLAILVQALFQWRALGALYDTPVRIILGQTLWLVPMAVALGYVARAAKNGSADHAGALLRKLPSRHARRTANTLWWRYKAQPVAAIEVLLFVWVYFEVILAAFLHPNGMEPLIVRIYNWMHFRQSLVLSAMVCVMVATPVIIVAALWGAGRLIMAADERRWTRMGRAK